ncbi:hypothetical protein ADK34_04255 [Streptomyces viridochromogenes]|uniref:Uncharacterized protein n=1 Tax=Streptomyces viridochromogenes TaxID=1938 RepID=A0A0L8LCJ7_STRVR|nr:hypothetical protein ADK34_04255 [Streptomyces viridochromogenes]
MFAAGRAGVGPARPEIGDVDRGARADHPGPPVGDGHDDVVVRVDVAAGGPAGSKSQRVTPARPG